MSDETRPQPELVFDTRPLREDQLFKQKGEDTDKLKRLLALLHLMGDQAESFHGSERDRRRKRIKKAPRPRIDWDRTPRILMFDGDRGTGKTSLMLTLIDRWERLRDKEFGVEPEVAMQRTGELGDWFKAEQARDLWFLPQLDLDPLPPGMPLFGWVIQRFLDLVRWLDDDPGLGDSRDPYLHRLAGSSGQPRRLEEDWQELYEGAVRAWARDESMTLRPDDLREFVFDQGQRQRAWDGFRDTWTAFIDRLLDMMEQKAVFGPRGLLVIPLDDLDMHIERAPEALRVLRHLYHRRVVFLVTGHTTNLQRILTADYFGRESSVGGRSWKTSRRYPRLLAQEVVRKYIPEEFRIQLSRLSLQQGLAWREKRVASLLEGEQTFDLLVQVADRFSSAFVDKPSFTIREWSQLASALAWLPDPTRETPSRTARLLQAIAKGSRFRVELRAGPQPLLLATEGLFVEATASRIGRAFTNDYGFGQYAKQIAFRADGDALDSRDLGLVELGLQASIDPDRPNLALRNIRFLLPPGPELMWSVPATPSGKVIWPRVPVDRPSYLLAQMKAWRSACESGFSNDQEAVAAWCAHNRAWWARSAGPSAPIQQLPEELAETLEAASKDSAAPTPGERSSKVGLSLRDFARVGLLALAHPIYALTKDTAAVVMNAVVSSQTGAPRYSAAWTRSVAAHLKEAEAVAVAQGGKRFETADLPTHPWSWLVLEVEHRHLAWLHAAVPDYRNLMIWVSTATRRINAIALFDVGMSMRGGPSLGTPVGRAVGELYALLADGTPNRAEFAHIRQDFIESVNAAFRAGAAMSGAIGLRQLWLAVSELIGADALAVLPVATAGDDGHSIALDSSVGRLLLRREPEPVLLGPSRVVAYTSRRWSVYFQESTTDLEVELDSHARIQVRAGLVVLWALQEAGYGTAAQSSEPFTSSERESLLGVALRGNGAELRPPPVRHRPTIMAWWVLWGEMVASLRGTGGIVAEGAATGVSARWVSNFLALSKAAILGLDGLGGGGNYVRADLAIPTFSDLVTMIEWVEEAAEKTKLASRTERVELLKWWATTTHSVAELLGEGFALELMNRSVWSRTTSARRSSVVSVDKGSPEGLE